MLVLISILMPRRIEDRDAVGMIMDEVINYLPDWRQLNKTIVMLNSLKARLCWSRRRVHQNFHWKKQSILCPPNIFLLSIWSISQLLWVVQNNSQNIKMIWYNFCWTKTLINNHELMGCSVWKSKTICEMMEYISTIGANDNEGLILMFGLFNAIDTHFKGQYLECLHWIFINRIN